MERISPPFFGRVGGRKDVSKIASNEARMKTINLPAGFLLKGAK